MEEVADARGRAVLFKVELLETVHLRVRFVNERVRLQQRGNKKIEREKKKKKKEKKKKKKRRVWLKGTECSSKKKTARTVELLSSAV